LENLSIINNEAESRFEAKTGNHLACLRYRKENDRIVFTHTEVPKEMEGVGVGSKLAMAGIEYAMEHQLKIVAECQFVAGFIQRHQEYQMLLSSK
jgi:hypothetical protein